jgi:hypothetical protein
VKIQQLIKIQVVFRNVLDYGAVGDGVTVSESDEREDRLVYSYLDTCKCACADLALAGI